MPKKYRAISVFMTLFAAVLAVYIGTTIFTTYKQNKNESMNLADTLSMKCMGISYDIKNFSYDGYELSMEVRNREDSIESIPSITVKGANTRSVDLSKFLPKLTHNVIISDIRIADNFTVYPANCEGYKKICYLSTGKCENIIG